MMIFLAPFHIGKGAESISEVGAPIGWIPLTNYRVIMRKTVGRRDLQLNLDSKPLCWLSIHISRVLSLAEVKASVCEQKNPHMTPVKDTSTILPQDPYDDIISLSFIIMYVSEVDQK
jgi:hypothetical protein